MKDKIITFFLVLMLFQCSAQVPTNFAPIGMRWEYNYFAYGQFSGKYVYESIKDTLYNGVQHRLINLTTALQCDYSGCQVVTSHYTYLLTIRNDSLLSTHIGQGGNYTFLFNFAYKAGDSIPYALYNQKPLKGVVKRIADTLINGKNLKFWEIKLTCPPATYQAGRVRLSKVFEFMGTESDGFFEFYDKCSSDPTFKELCRVDSGNWNYNPLICRYSVGINEFVSTDIMVSPNPTADIVELNVSHDGHNLVFDVELYNAVGQLVYKKRMTPSESRLDIADKPKGFYNLILRNASDKKIVFSHKLIKI